LTLVLPEDQPLVEKKLSKHLLRVSPTQSGQLPAICT
jgi:hypothetical protein